MKDKRTLQQQFITLYVRTYLLTLGVHRVTVVVMCVCLSVSQSVNQHLTLRAIL